MGLLPTLGICAVLWTVSSWLYYYLVDALDLELGYSDAPFIFFAYYLGWSIIAMAVFRRALRRALRPTSIRNHTLALLPVLVCLGLFVSVGLPMLPDVSIYRAPADPPEFMFATAWYYLPKSADILFQQVMVAAIILTAAHLRMKTFRIALILAALFGSIHLSLALDGFTPLYVARFTIAATVFGLCAPYLYLNVRHGFRWAYSAHWSFYAIDAAVTHLVLAAPPPSTG